MTTQTITETNVQIVNEENVTRNAKLSALKADLKNLSQEIKKAKIECKEQQRKSGGYSEHQWKILSQKHHYRHRHIAYCLLRGRKYEDIEPNVREGNEPNWTYIEGVRDAYAV